MGLQPIQKRHANKELDVLLSQDFRCCCCRCPGERSLSVISSLFNTGRWRRAALRWWSPKGKHCRRPAHFFSGCPPHMVPLCSHSFSITWYLSLSYTHIHTHSHFFSVPQIKEAADIIQKLHLIAQELPFDRWVRHPEGSFRQKQWHTRGTQSITFVPLSVIATLNLYSVMWFLKIVYFFILLVYRLKCHWYWFPVFLCQVCRCQGKNCK